MPQHCMPLFHLVLPCRRQRIRAFGCPARLYPKSSLFQSRRNLAMTNDPRLMVALIAPRKQAKQRAVRQQYQCLLKEIQLKEVHHFNEVVHMELGKSPGSSAGRRKAPNYYRSLAGSASLLPRPPCPAQSSSFHLLCKCAHHISTATWQSLDLPQWSRGGSSDWQPSLDKFSSSLRHSTHFSTPAF